MQTLEDLKDCASCTKKAASRMRMASSEQKNQVLSYLVTNLTESQQAIYDANELDISQARDNSINDTLLERLSLKHRLDEIIKDIKQVIDLPDPVGEILEEKVLPNQLHLSKRRVPIGVLGIIYESRPNVTIDISVLTIKSGNCAILRGGSETFHTNQVLIRLIKKSLTKANLPSEAIQYVANSDRALVKELLCLHNYIDLIIPRGSETLQSFCRQHSTIPVITGGIGICHLYVDETANLERCLPVILNAKTQRPSVCNALDTLLVHSSIAPHFLPKVVKQLSSKGVTFRLDPKAWELCHHPACTPASSKDWNTEWLSLVLGIKVVESMQEAIDHISQYSTGHSDGIFTESKENGDYFLNQVDASTVYLNASTRFTDGGQFGFGAEVAISTQKVHARGPMGLNELTSYKWVVKGDYQIRN